MKLMRLISMLVLVVCLGISQYIIHQQHGRLQRDSETLAEVSSTMERELQALKGCDSALAATVKEPKPPTARASHCKPLDIKKTETGCTYDDGLMECHTDFLQPHTWGRCVMLKDKSLACANKGVIAHYPEGAANPDWKMGAADCALVAKQIQERGQGDSLGITIQIPVSTPEPKGPKT
jgi:hypothetical protein